MIWKRLKKSTPEEEKEFEERMSDEKLTFKDKLAMIISAILIIVLPCLVILLALSFLLLWIFGAF